MKTIIYKAMASVLVLSLVFLLTSCGGSTPCALSVVEELAALYGVDGVSYFSKRTEDEEGYIDSELWNSLFVLRAPTDMEYALLLNSRLDSLCEVGVFVSDNAETRYIMADIIEERLEFLASSPFEGEGFSLRRGCVIAYGFLPDAQRAKAILSGLI